MGLANTFGRMFMPKNTVFYELFEDVAVTVKQIGTQLKVYVNESDKDKRSTLLTKIEDLEHHNDDNTHKIFTELGRNFITPFDREDIHYLATALDDIADYIYTTAKKIQIYNVNPNDTSIYKMADLIEKATNEVVTVVNGLRNMKDLRPITEAMVRINSIENQADDVYDLSIEKLFEMENDIKMLIKKREIFSGLENVTDKCEDAANVVESIIIKYA